MNLTDPLADALLAARLLALAPGTMGGIVLRGSGPARELVLEQLHAMAGQRPWRRLPLNIDDERLLGGIDLAASLAGSAPVLSRGLLDEAAGGFLIVPMAEKLRPELAGKLAQALDERRDLTLVLLDDGLESDERPPAALVERAGLHCDLSAVAALIPVDKPATEGRTDAAPLDRAAQTALAQTTTALGIDSMRALLFAESAARANAASSGRVEAGDADLAVAARLVLAPRATQVPQAHDEPDAPETPPDPGEGMDDNQVASEASLEDRLLEAALASIPPDLLAKLAAGGATRRKASGGGAGQRTRSRLRGRPLSARPGLPRGGARLALVDTLRAAVPWQRIRGAGDRLTIRKDDLRIRRFEERSAAVTIFCVDASGSAAFARLAEAKGAVERMLAQAYVTRGEVALIAFRGHEAELLLPPTRSLTRARRALAGLPGGGGTPLASGLVLARSLAESVVSRGYSPQIVVLTDGSANIALDGAPGRAQARQDAEKTARAIGNSAIDALVIDISPRARPEAEALARAMQSRYLALPMADAEKLERAIKATTPGRRAA